MNVKEYISSGIVESYVLGLVTETEQQEFEANCAQYPEIAQAREAFELSLENSLLQDAVAPPSHLKETIRAAVLNTNNLYQATENSDSYETPVRRMNPWKWVAAASVVLLAGALFWGYSENAKNNELEGLAQQNRILQTRLDSSAKKLNELEVVASTLQNPQVKMASLQGTDVSPASFANIYWDTTTKDVYLLVNNMPTTPSDKQYQLWALMNGKPVDLGVIGADVWQEKLLVKMKGVNEAQAFAITLEPKGGSVNPTMDQMYVVGKL